MPKFAMDVVMLLLVIAGQALQAQNMEAEGLVISRATVSDGPEYYAGSLFKGYIDTGAWLSFDVWQKKRLEIEKGHIVKVVHFENGGRGNAFSMDITNDDDAQSLVAFRAQLKEQTAAMPKLEATVKALCGALDNHLALYRAGNIRLSGRWTDKLAWDKAREQESKAVRIVNGKSYKNPKFVSFEDDRLTMSHEAGIAKFETGKLTDDEKRQLTQALQIDPEILLPKKAVAAVPAAVPTASLIDSNMPPPPLAVPPALVIKPLPEAPVRPQLPRAPLLPAFIDEESLGKGLTENEAVRDALCKVVDQTIHKYLGSGAGGDDHVAFRERINAHISAVLTEHEKIATKRDRDTVAVIVKSHIGRDKFITLLTDLNLIRR